MFTNNGDMAAIGRRLKLLRYALGYHGHGDMTAFANMVGITNPSQWTQYEKGGKRIQIDVAINVSIATGVPLDWIYLGTLLTQVPSQIREAFPDAQARIDAEANSTKKNGLQPKAPDDREDSGPPPRRGRPPRPK